MVLSCQSVAESIAGILARRPVLEPVLKTFQPLLEARASLPAALAPLVREAGLRLPELQPEQAAEGRPLLFEAPLPGLGGLLRQAAESLLPLLTEQEAVAPYADRLRGFFLGGTAADSAPALTALAECVLRGDEMGWEKSAVGMGVPPEVLTFVFDFLLGPALRALADVSLEAGQEAPWDKEGVWKEGYCPVCGSFPSIGYLDRPVFEEKNAFLAGGGGKKRLHCSLCGTDWKFRRGACPACGEEGNGVMEVLRESGNAQGERLEWCTRCKTYCPGVDLRERDTVPDLDVLALGLVHLDMVAAEKKLRPLNPSFWNTF